MIKRGEIKHVWYLTGRNGRPPRVLSNRPVEEHKRWHEVGITTVLQALGYEYRRLSDVDRDLLPDFEMMVRGELHYGEFHTGKMRGRKIEDRLSLYERVGSPVLWIVPTETERQKLRSMDRNENSHFGLVEEVVNNPKGEIWLDVNGQFLTL